MVDLLLKRIRTVEFEPDDARGEHAGTVEFHGAGRRDDALEQSGHLSGLGAVNSAEKLQCKMNVFRDSKATLKKVFFAQLLLYTEGFGLKGRWKIQGNEAA